MGKTDIELAIDDLWEGHELESEAHKGAHLLERERQRARIEVPPSRVVVLCAVVCVCVPWRSQLTVVAIINDGLAGEAGETQDVPHKEARQGDR